MRKSTLWNLRKVSTRISLSMPHRPTRIYTFRLLWIFCFRNHYSIHLSPKTECVGRISLRGQRRLIWSIYYADVYRHSCILGQFRKKCVGTCIQWQKGATPLPLTLSKQQESKLETSWQKYGKFLKLEYLFNTVKHIFAKGVNYYSKQFLLLTQCV